jgi:hypothetical protein
MNREKTQSDTVELPKNFLQKLKIKWGLESIFQVVVILLVFSLTGSTVVYLRKALFLFLGFTDETSFWIKSVTYIAFIFPSYQILILIYGFIFGQFNFFWQKEMKMVKSIANLFRR